MTRKDYTYSLGGYERKCPVCGKSIFITTTEWAYKRSNGGKAVRYMCSYSCLLKYDKEHPVKRRNRWHMEE